MADDEASGVYWHLSSLPDVLAVTGSFPADEPDNSSVPWIFVRNVYTRMEDVSIVNGSQAVAAAPVCPSRCGIRAGRGRPDPWRVLLQCRHVRQLRSRHSGRQQ